MNPRSLAPSTAMALRHPTGAFLSLALALMLGLASPANVLAKAAMATPESPTIVLVHGAWAGPGGWDEVTAGLQKDGYTTVTPRLAMMHLADDVDAVEQALDSIAGPKIVVSHSYGGMVASAAAAGRSDVVALVYTAAFVPNQGDTVLDLGAGYAPPAALAHLVWTGPPFASLAYIDSAYFREDFAQELNPKLAARLDGEQQPISFEVFATPSGPVAWHAVPSWYAISGADRMIDPALQRAEAAKIGATMVTFDDASHAGGFTHYSARLVKLIEQAAAATGQ